MCQDILRVQKPQKDNDFYVVKEASKISLTKFRQVFMNI